MIAYVTYDMTPFLIALTSVAIVGISWLMILEFVVKSKNKEFWLLTCLLTGFNILTWTFVLR